MIKGSIHPEDRTAIYIFTPHIRAKKYTKEKWAAQKGEIDNSATITGDFNTPPKAMDRTTKRRSVRK